MVSLHVTKSIDDIRSQSQMKSPTEESNPLEIVSHKGPYCPIFETSSILCKHKEWFYSDRQLHRGNQNCPWSKEDTKYSPPLLS